MKTRFVFLDKMVDWILANSHCIRTGYVGDEIETVYRMKDGTKYRIMLNNDYEIVSVNVA